MTTQPLTERADKLLRDAAGIPLTDPFAAGEVMLSTIYLLRDLADAVEQVEARRTIEAMRDMCRETSAGPDAAVQR